MTPTCLTIAGSDSGGEAGIQADLKAFLDLEVFGTSVITANTAQNPKRIISVNPVNSNVLQDQLDAVIQHFNPQNIKTGLIYDIDQIRAIDESLESGKTIVSDPLILSTSGTRVMRPDAAEYYKSTFIKRVTIVTPNFNEMEFLIDEKIDSKEKIEDSLKKISHENDVTVYLKGGHSSDPSTDYLYDGHSLYSLRLPEVRIKSSHGTGCRLSSALCAAISLGHSMIEASTIAKNYVYNCLKNCLSLESGIFVMNNAGKQIDNLVEIQEIK